MNKLFSFLLLLSVVFMFSCNQNKVYSETEEFENNRWYANNIVEFSPKIEDVDMSYNVIFTLSHVYNGFPFEDLNVNLKIIRPSGDVEKQTHIIKVRDGKDHVGDCAGDYCDVEQVIIKDYKFEEKGTYTFEIAHNAPLDPVPNIMEIGIRIDKVE